jgi:hypothetical protein
VNAAIAIPIAASVTAYSSDVPRICGSCAASSVIPAITSVLARTFPRKSSSCGTTVISSSAATSAPSFAAA